MFWSDLGSAIGYEAIGLVDSHLPTTAIFAKFDPNDDKRSPYNEHLHELSNANASKSTEEKPPVETVKVDVKDCPPNAKGADDYTKGVVFYMQKDKIVGILLWNVFNRISIARKILMSDETFEDLNEVAKLFDIFEQQKDKQN
jgi:programmed cell death 8 (apoptosis-inducing factor)